MNLSSNDIQQLKRISAWFRRMESQGASAFPQRLPRMLSGQIVKIGKADNEITAGSSGTVSIWRESADTTEEIEAYLDWLTDQNISAGKEVAAAWFADEAKWRIIAAECEDPSEPEIFQAGNTGTAETLTTTFAKITGMTLAYTSGSAIVPTAPAA